MCVWHSVAVCVFMCACVYACLGVCVCVCERVFECACVCMNVFHREIKKEKIQRERKVERKDKN